VIPGRAKRHAGASDTELIDRIRCGDLGALGVLYDRHERNVRGFVIHLGCAHGDVDDVVQTTFLQVHRAARGFDGRATPRAWLLGLAANVVRRHRRSMARWIRRIVAFAAEGEHREPMTPEDSLEIDEDVRRVQRGLEKLSEQKRAVFVLVVLQGVRGEEAAAALGIPVATVWTRLHHARRELRALLEAP